MAAIKEIRVGYSDEDVQKRVSRFLSSRHFPAFRNIKVDVRRGKVTLKGSVCSYYEKQVALNSCRRVAGVLTTQDDLVVDPVMKAIETKFSSS